MDEKGYQKRYQTIYQKKHKEKMAKYHAEWYQKNKDTERIKKNKRRLKTRNDVLKLYGGNPPQCICCGEKNIEFLTIDHIKGGGTKESKSFGGSYQMYRHIKKLFLKDRERALKTYRVLCYNCNCSIGHYGYCPHKKY